MSTRNILIGVVVVLLIGAAIFGAVKVRPSTENTSSSSPGANNPVSNESQIEPQTDDRPLSKNKKLSEFPGILKQKQLKNKKAIIQTNKGVIELEIYPEATMAASNFIYLSENGFYDGLTFHRVEKNFVIQGGDPLGNGRGGPGYKFEDEPVTMDYTRGIVAMANAGPDTNGSQFFIMLSDHPELPKKYTIFGKVISGQDVVDKITIGDIMQKVTIQENHSP